MMLCAVFSIAASFNGDLSTWDVSSVTTMYASELGYLCIVLGILGRVITEAKEFGWMQWKCFNFICMRCFRHSHESVFSFLPLFNGNLASWDVSAVKDMQQSKSQHIVWVGLEFTRFSMSACDDVLGCIA